MIYVNFKFSVQCMINFVTFHVCCRARFQMFL